MVCQVQKQIITDNKIYRVSKQDLVDRIEKLRQSKEKDKLLPNLKDRMDEVLGSLKKLKLCEKNAFGFIIVKNKTKIV